MNNRVSNDFEKYGCSYLLSNNAYEDYIQGRDVIGRSDGQFVTPSNQIDELLSKHQNDPREWEHQLGLNEGSLGNEDIRRVDVYCPQNHEPRLPSGDLSGANDKFLDGGKTPGGQDECVINPFPNPESNPSVGKITNLSNSMDNTQTADTNKYSNISSNNIESLYGGGANAPNETSNSTFDVHSIILTPKGTSSADAASGLAGKTSGGMGM